MATEQRLFKCERDDPKRCQGMIRTGQCPFISVNNTQYCQLHQGGIKNADTTEQTFHNYRLSKWQSRINEFASNSNVKSLREEIGITRLMLEEIINKCHDTSDLILYSTKISDLVMKIEKLVSSCHRLEYSTGSLLDKTTVIHLSTLFVEIISQHIVDIDILEQISDKMFEAVLTTKVSDKGVFNKRTGEVEPFPIRNTLSAS